jgi:hypothetical protein
MRQPLLSNGLANKRAGTATTELQQWRCFLRGPCQGDINGTSLEFRQLRDIFQTVRILAKDIVKIH